MKYSEIKALALSYADRSDLATTSRMDSFISMAESRINRLLKTRKQSARMYTAAIRGQDYYPLPTDYLGMRSIKVVHTTAPDLATSSVGMEYLTPDQLDLKRGTHAKDGYYYTIIDDQFFVHPRLPDGYTIEIVYYRRVPPLSEECEENWLSEACPDIYISAIVAEISVFIKDYEAAGIWAERVSLAIQELDTTDAQERWTAATLTTRVG